MPSHPLLFDGSEPLREFLAATAARRPTPGGGSVTAVVGALAAAIGEMSLSYSVGKNTPPEQLPKIQAATQALQQHRNTLLQLMERDQVAYSALAELHRLPEDAPDRESRLQAAVTDAVNVPEAIAAAGLSILQQCEAIADLINPRLLSDLAVCADLAMATVRCAIYNARVNLPELNDQAALDTHNAQINRTLSGAAMLIQRVSPQIWNRYAEMQQAG